MFKALRWLISMRWVRVCAAAVCALTMVETYAQLPVFPGAVGFGIQTEAGRGGQIIRVTTLNDSGAGSLREAVETTGRRTIIFDVSGTIFLQSNIVIRDPFITIAGQTAPSPGITLAYAGLIIKSHDVLVQHLRVRPGDRVAGPDKEDRDALAMTGDSNGNTAVFNVVIDHCSFSWGVDENVSSWHENVHDLTLTNSIVSEGLMNAGHPEGSHSMGYLIGDHTKNASVVNNLFAHNSNRNPLVKGDVSAYIANNVIYNFGNQPIVFGDRERSGPSSTTVIGNDIVLGLSTESDYGIHFSQDVSQGTMIYLEDNRFADQIPDDPWSMALVRVDFNVKADTPPVILPQSLDIVPVEQIRQQVLTNAGARPADRDAVDARVVDDVRNGTGELIDSQQQVGGWPNLENNRRVLELPTDPAADDDGDGYTNLENWLHRLAAEVEGRGNPQPGKIGVADVNLSEGDGVASLVVSLDRPLAEDVEVVVYTQPGTAANGIDFFGLGRRLRFESGTVSQTVQVQVLDNELADGNKYFFFYIHIVDPEKLTFSKRVAAVFMFDDD